MIYLSATLAIIRQKFIVLPKILILFRLSKLLKTCDIAVLQLSFAELLSYVLFEPWQKKYFMTEFLDNPAPVFDANHAAAFVIKTYGISGKFYALESERDLNFLLTTEDEERFVFKIANCMELGENLETQNEVLEHLADVAPNLSLPRIKSSKDGNAIELIEIDGISHLARLVTWVPGGIAAEASKPQRQLRNLGGFLGCLDNALSGFIPRHSIPPLKWDLRHARQLRQDLKFVQEPDKRTMAESILDEFDRYISKALKKLPAQIIHNDANDWNVLIDPEDQNLIAGLIDFGDLVHSHRICELAVAAPYFLFEQSDILTSLRALISGYHAEFALLDEELQVLWGLIQVRLVTTIIIGEKRFAQDKSNAYLLVSLQPAWELLQTMQSMNAEVAYFACRTACGLTPNPNEPKIAQWLSNLKGFESPASVFDYDLTTSKKAVLNFCVDSPDLDGDAEQSSTKAFTQHLFRRIADAGAKIGIGIYGENRVVYRGDQFSEHAAEGEMRSMHTGIDVFDEAGTPIYAPLDGEVISAINNTEWLDYGPTIILRHQPDNLDCEFYTLYGHLALESLEGLDSGKKVSKGERLGWLGNYPINGDWPPHLHFQVMTSLLGMTGNFPGVAPQSQWDVWSSICIDPNLILGIPNELFEKQGRSANELLSDRKQKIGYNLSLSYKSPLKIVRGEGTYLYDDDGRAYLDCVNNICHVGHSHPRVVQAIEQQASLLNTNTRYLHENLIHLAERIIALMPGNLSVCYFACTGTEANDLAFRMAKAATGGEGGIVLDGAYHGHSNTLIDLSPYKFKGLGGHEMKPWVEVAEMPDPYRGRHRYGDTDIGGQYAQSVHAAAERLKEKGYSPAAFYAESIQSCGGQIMFPEDYLKQAYQHVRSAGAVAIADEVQVGFGRSGSHFWAFEQQDIVPDIVTLGKPMGNGHPISAVITTPEIATAFDNGMEYFNSFGGNPVSCAAALAVLDILEEEDLQANAQRTGEYLLKELRRLQQNHQSIGDVRGTGLFLGAEITKDRETREPDALLAEAVINWLRDERAILLSTDGPDDNVFKIKPPMIFGFKEADYFIESLNEALLVNN